MFIHRNRHQREAMRHLRLAACSLLSYARLPHARRGAVGLVADILRTRKAVSEL